MCIVPAMPFIHVEGARYSLIIHEVLGYGVFLAMSLKEESQRLAS